MINTSSLQVINGLISSTFPPMLNFLAKEATAALMMNADMNVRKSNETALHIKEVSQFLAFFSALLDVHLLRERHEKDIDAAKPPENAQEGTGMINEPSQVFIVSVFRLYGKHQVRSNTESS
jgi:hypothetical protein